jgi:hypothetical protein
MMAGGEDMENLSAELAEFERTDREAPAGSEDERLADAFRQETEEMRREEEDPRHGGARE